MVAVFFKKEIDGQNEVKFDGANGAFFDEQNGFFYLTYRDDCNITPIKVGQFFADYLLGFYVEED